MIKCVQGINKQNPENPFKEQDWKVIDFCSSFFVHLHFSTIVISHHHSSHHNCKQRIFIVFSPLASSESDDSDTISFHQTSLLIEEFSLEFNAINLGFLIIVRITVNRLKLSSLFHRFTD